MKNAWSQKKDSNMLIRTKADNYQTTSNSNVDEPKRPTQTNIKGNLININIHGILCQINFLLLLK